MQKELLLTATINTFIDTRLCRRYWTMNCNQKGQPMKNTIKSIGLIILDIVLLVLFVLFISKILWHIVGPDFIEYENWAGTMSNPIRYRFGAGSCGLVFILARMIGFSIGQSKILKDNSKKQFVIAMILHIVIGVLGLIYFIKSDDGQNIIYNIQILLDR